VATKHLRYLTDAEIKMLQRLLDAAKLLDPSLKSAQDGLWSHGEDQSAPEVYVARPINGVIPAMTPASSTGTGTGTGTAPECDIYDSPGYAECRIYEIIDTDNCGPALMEVEDHDEKVYNLSETEISTGGDYIPVMRDKFGKWLAVPPSGGSPIKTICLTSTLAQGQGQTATATDSDTGETYIIYDPHGEFYGAVGAGGYAFQSSYDSIGTLRLLRVTCPGFTSVICSGTSQY